MYKNSAKCKVLSAKYKKAFTLKHYVNKGFTLIELLVSIGILAVLMAGVVSLIGQGPRQSARDGRRQADLQTIASALELYRHDNQTYPPNLAALVPNYMTATLSDPIAGNLYPYSPLGPAGVPCNPPTTRCVTYDLCSILEKSTAVVSCGGSCGGTCRYQVTNP